MESLLAGELRGLGIEHARQARAGVSFEGELRTAYLVCLWSRLAGRVLLPLVTGPAADGDELYATALRVDWDAHLDTHGTLVVDFTGTSDAIRDTRYGTVRIKDAIVDQFRARHDGVRPSVDPHSPDLRVNGHLGRDRVTISLDLSGDSLHRRGYRTDRMQVEAPLKENLAAAMLLYAAWPQEAAAGGSLLDPLCGSGTLPIEAAMIAADVAPGLLRAEGEGAPVARRPPAAAPHGSGRPGTPPHRGRHDRPRRGDPREEQPAAPPGFGFTRWLGHDAAAWDELVGEARERRAAGLGRLAAAAPGQTVSGSDRDARSVDVARACVKKAGLADVVAIGRGDVRELRPPAAGGIVAANLPYGERLGRREDAEALAAELGERLRLEFPGWRAALLTGSRHQAAAAGLRVLRETTLRNGPLEATLSFCDVAPADGHTGARPADERNARAAVRSSKRPRATDAGEAPAHASSSGTSLTAEPDQPAAAASYGSPDRARQVAPEDAGPDSPQPAAPARRPGMLGGGAEQLANRLHKNLRRLGKQLRRESITCYRLYDADLPEYNFVVDVYGDWVHVAEYAAPPEIDPAKTARRLDDALAVIGAVLEAPPERVVLKQRRRQRGAAQYERRERGGEFLPVTEDDLTYLVNLRDYLDTGLFVDQRLTRRLVRTLAGGRRFLNLFAYTGTMTVDALAGGSQASTTVDLSGTYLEWARRNLEANGFSASLELSAGADAGRGKAAAQAAASPHHLVQADCLRWLATAEGRYDLIWLDPPTFSNSKRMGTVTFDVQRDHPDLLRMTARRLLAPGGVLLFATNRRGFHLQRDELTGLTVTDLSRATLPFDCTRAANRHHVFRLEHTAR